jgi:hypothetical protein
MVTPIEFETPEGNRPSNPVLAIAQQAKADFDAMSVEEQNTFLEKMKAGAPPFVQALESEVEKLNLNQVRCFENAVTWSLVGFCSTAHDALPKPVLQAIEAIFEQSLNHAKGA